MKDITIVFKGNEHQARFLAAVQNIGKVYEGKIDPEYGAALYVLTSDSRMWQQARGYVERGGILFEEMLNGCDWSGGYRVLLQWAANLFNEHALPAIGPVELMRLDERNFEIALSALQIRRGGLDSESVARKEQSVAAVASREHGRKTCRPL